MRKAPIYVKIDEYKDLLDIMSLLRHKIGESRRVLDKIQDLKNEEDKELASWTGNLDDVERKIDFVDKSLFEPESL